jgi:hypothetical protein
MLGCLVVASCGSQSEFSNKLTFGTGYTASDLALTGESNSFSLAQLGSGPIYFRFESAADIGNRFVRLYFNDIYNYDFTPTQNYGHILISYIYVSNEGTYQVKADLVETIIDIGKETHVVDATLTVTP